jgi:ring-1,2-phenylacetyl-CoA epoxidase subunit PaaE
MSQFHALKVAAVDKVTDAAIAIRFDVPDDLRETFGFIQGQYLTVRADIDGEDVRRSYSICSGVDDGELRVAVKRVPDGRFSNYANENIRPGDILQVMPPMGNFHTALDSNAHRNYVGFAGGSGITPFLAIIRTILAREPGSIFTLFYGNRTVADIMFREELSDLKDLHLDRFRLIHILSDERPDLDLFHGLMTPDKVTELMAGLVDIDGTDYFYICGPGPMTDSVRGVLDKAGIPAAKQKYELFGSPLPQAGPKTFADPDGKSSDVTVVINGNRTDFKHPAEGQSILDGALARNLDLPFACKGGVCCTCRAKLIEGEVTMDVSFGLEPDEIKAGYILTCQSHPVSEKVVIDYDA